jgi:NADPH2:quinone reductase
MRAVWYDRQGAADEVLVCGELPRPEAGHGEVRVRLESVRRQPVGHLSAAWSAGCNSEEREGSMSLTPGILKVTNGYAMTEPEGRARAGGGVI